MNKQVVLQAHKGSGETASGGNGQSNPTSGSIASGGPSGDATP